MFFSLCLPKNIYAHLARNDQLFIIIIFMFSLSLFYLDYSPNNPGL
jgi:hypothetical protein